MNKRMIGFVAIFVLLAIVSCADTNNADDQILASDAYKPTNAAEDSVFYVNGIPYPYPGPEISSSLVTPIASTTPTIIPQRAEFIYDSLNLVWQECNLSYQNMEMAEECLGISWPIRTDEDEQNIAIPDRETGIPRIQLMVGADIYESMPSRSTNHLDKYALIKNGEVIFTITSEMTGYDPNQRLMEFDGKVIWEFAAPEGPTIVYDGKDIRKEYNLDAVYSPYELGEKLIFVVQKDSKFYVVYDWQQLGPEFDEISFAYCCDAKKPIMRLQGQYWFWGFRENQNYIVAITPLR